MVGVFFLCKNSVMDVVKLFDLLLDDEELQDVPQEHIFRVAYEVISIMSTGEVFYRPIID